MYPFGYGLSYTRFAFNKASSDKEIYSPDEVITITVDVKNTGKVDGKEVVQLYSSKTDSKIDRAAQELKGFTKILVKAGETQEVIIKVPVKELAYYDVTNKKWTVEPGKYKLRLGNSSRNIKKEIDIIIK